VGENKMEIIWTGILLAIGFYLAPTIISLIGVAFMVILGLIASLFNTEEK